MDSGHTAALKVIILTSGHFGLQMRLRLSKNVECLPLKSGYLHVLNVSSIVDGSLSDTVSFFKSKILALIGNFSKSLGSLCIA